MNTKKAKEREVRRLASKIPDEETLDCILLAVGDREPNDTLREAMKQSVRAQLIPYLKFELKAAK